MKTTYVMRNGQLVEKPTPVDHYVFKWPPVEPVFLYYERLRTAEDVARHKWLYGEFEVTDPCLNIVADIVG